MPYRSKNASTNAGSTGAVPALMARMLARSSRGMSESSTSHRRRRQSCHRGPVLLHRGVPARQRESLEHRDRTGRDQRLQQRPQPADVHDRQRHHADGAGQRGLGPGLGTVVVLQRRRQGGLELRAGQRDALGAPVVPDVSISIATAGSPLRGSLVPRARTRLRGVKAPAGCAEFGDGPANTSSDHSADGARTKAAPDAARSALSLSGGCSGLMVTSVRPPRKIAMSAATDSIRLPEHDGDPATCAASRRGQFPVDPLGERPNGPPGRPASVALQHAGVVVGVPEPSQCVVDARHRHFPNRLSRESRSPEPRGHGLLGQLSGRVCDGLRADR